MYRSRFRPYTLGFVAATLFFAGVVSVPAYAENKDMIRLETEIQQLQDAIARLQQSNDERMGVLKDLVQQTADSVNKMSVEMNGVKLGLQNQQDAIGTKSDQLSGQVQSLNDSLDELKARMARMEKTLGDIQSQQQSANAVLNNLPQGSGSMPPTGSGPAAGQPLPSNPPQDQGASQAAPAGGPAVGDMYRTAYSDYMSAKYPLATSEFADLIKAYPDDNLAGNAYFYMGEMAIRTQKPTLAVKDYDHLLERYPDNAKIPAAHLHKGEALIALKQNENGVRELRALMQRFPNSPEAAQAKQRLAAMHVSSVSQ